MIIFELVNKGIGNYGLGGIPLTENDLLQIEDDSDVQLTGHVTGTGVTGAPIAVTITEKVISDQTEQTDPLLGTEYVLGRLPSGALVRIPTGLLSGTIITASTGLEKIGNDIRLGVDSSSSRKVDFTNFGTSGSIVFEADRTNSLSSRNQSYFGLFNSKSEILNPKNTFLLNIQSNYSGFTESSGVGIIAETTPISTYSDYSVRTSESTSNLRMGSSTSVGVDGSYLQLYVNNYQTGNKYQRLNLTTTGNATFEDTFLNRGLVNAGDYEANFIPRSLITLQKLTSEILANAYVHPSFTAFTIDTATAQVIDQIITTTQGHISNITLRNLTLADIGYTGDPNANNYIHPSYTAQNPTLSGALVLASIITDTIGSVTGITTRTLTPANIGAININQLGVANGVATLDTGGKLTTSQIPDSLLGGLKWKGRYNGTIISDSPDLTLNGTALPTPSLTNEGWYFISIGTYIVGLITFNDGDWILSNGINWLKVDNTDQVTSVFGRMGAISALAGDYSGFYVRHDINTQGLLVTNQGNARTNINAEQVIIGAATTITQVNLTIDRALISDASGKVVVSIVTSTELGYVGGVTSNIQTQLNTKLSGNQIISLSGDVTGSGATSIATTISNNAVTTTKILDANVIYAKIQNVSANRILGQTAVTGIVKELTPAEIRSIINVADGANNYIHPNHSGDIVSVSDGVTTIQPNVVTDNKLRQSVAYSVIGRSITLTGNVSDIVAGTDGVLRRSGAGDLIFGTLVTGNIGDSQVIYAKIQNVTADRMLGRLSTTGVIQELTATQIRTLINVSDGANNYVHPTKTWIDKVALTGANVISNITIDSLGHPTDWVTRVLTLADLGLTAPVQGSGTLNYLPKWTPDGVTLGNSQIFDNGSLIGINTITPLAQIHSKGTLSSVLSGTVAVTNLSATVTGTSTLFTTELAVGDSIKIGSEIFTVSAIASATSLTLDTAYQGTTASGLTGFRDPDLFRIDNGDGVNKLLINRSGRVGAGTINPLNKVDIYDTNPDGQAISLRTYGTNTGAKWAGRIVAGGTNVAFLMGEYNAKAWLGAHNSAINAWADLYINPDGAKKLFLGAYPSSATPLVTIDNASGNIGIGTINPLSKLSFGSGGGNNNINKIALSEEANGDFFYGISYLGTPYGLGLFTGKIGPLGIPDIFIQAPSGFVGFATTDPTNTIDVNGTARIRSVANATGNFATLSATGVLQQRTLTETKSDLGITTAVNGSGTLNYLPKWTPDGVILGNSQIYDDGTFVGLGTVSPGAKLDVNGSIFGAYGTGQKMIFGAIVSNGIYKYNFLNDRSVDTTFVRLALFEGKFPSTQTGVASMITFKMTVPNATIVDGTGPGFLFALQGLSGTENFIGRVSVSRNGADNTGVMGLDVTNAGTLTRIITLLNTGYVGIGTTDPTNTIDVNGTARIRSVANATGNFATFSATGVLQQRTAVEARGDIGAQIAIAGTATNGFVATVVAGVATWAAGATSGNYVTLDTVQTITAKKTFNADVDLGGALLVTATSLFISNAGTRFYKQAEHGTVIQASTGTVNDFALISSSGALKMTINTLDSNIVFNKFDGSFTGFGNITPTEKIDTDGTARLRGMTSGTGENVVVDATGVLKKGPAGGSSKWTDVGVGNIYRNSFVSINQIVDPTQALDINGTARLRGISTHPYYVGGHALVHSDSTGVLRKTPFDQNIVQNVVINSGGLTYTYTSATLRYVRVADIVHFSVYIQALTSTGIHTGGGLRITLPFYAAEVSTSIYFSQGATIHYMKGAFVSGISLNYSGVSDRYLRINDISLYGEIFLKGEGISSVITSYDNAYIEISGSYICTSASGY